LPTIREEHGVKGPFAREDGHEQVVFTRDDTTGLACIIAIHSTALGPALGGTRFRAYETEDEALTDVLRLSRAMTYKNACAGLDLGGGKAVIVGDPEELRSEALFRAFGRAVESLGGRYITACDVGTTPADMAIIQRETRWVTGTFEVDGGSGDSGVVTAQGVYLAMHPLAEAVFGTPSLSGRHIAVQGLGKVGARLVGHLVGEGAKVTVADIDPEAIDRVADVDGVEVVDVDDVLLTDADIISPNALGGVINETLIPKLQAQAICGGANNQLGTHDDAVQLHERGILYAPDYVVNAGGVINVANELHPLGYSSERAHQRVDAIPATLRNIIEVSRKQDITTDDAALHVAEERIAAVSGTRQRFWLPSG
jgi:valine dehydrogenase (NAD+)